jgi:hypothetical protein
MADIIGCFALITPAGHLPVPQKIQGHEAGRD